MSSNQKKKLISFIVPVLNEEENVEPLYKAVTRVMESLSNNYQYEIVFTDNHSQDHTFEKLTHLVQIDQRVKAIRFSRNFGHQRSIYTGYTYCKGDAAIQLDCDLQDPPELIPEFIKLWESGYQVVYGVRLSRKESWWIAATRKLFYRIINWLSEYPLPLDAGDFRLVDKQILTELRKIQDYDLYLRGLIAAMGFKQIGVPYARLDRHLGKSKFSLSGYVRLAIDGILNHSVVPLQFSTYVGIFVSILTIFIGLVYVALKMFFGLNWPAGFTTITVLILLSLSINALFLGIIGEYIGRIYRQVKKQPVVIIEKSLNCEENH